VVSRVSSICRWWPLRWTVFALGLVGLGLYLNAVLSPRPRCTIPSSTSPIGSTRSVDCLSPDGSTLVTYASPLTPLPFHFPTTHGLIQGPATLGEGRLVSTELHGPVEEWDTHSDRCARTYAVSNYRYSGHSPSCRYLAVFAQTDDETPGILHLVDLKSGHETRLHLNLPAPRLFTPAIFHFSAGESFLMVVLWSLNASSAYLVDTK
jgi:hypothetical protein